MIWQPADRLVGRARPLGFASHPFGSVKNPHREFSFRGLPFTNELSKDLSSKINLPDEAANCKASQE